MGRMMGRAYQAHYTALLFTGGVWAVHASQILCLPFPRKMMSTLVGLMCVLALGMSCV